MKKYSKRLVFSLLCILVIFMTVNPFSKVYAANKTNSNETSQSTTATQQINFKDIKNNWAKSSIDELSSLGIISGYKDFTFRPNNPVTRAQFVAMISKLFNYQLNGTPQDFTDISKSFWAYSAIEASVEKGVINKEEIGQNFKPNKAISRENMTEIVARALKLTQNSAAVSYFSDSKKINNPGLVGAVYSAGIISGHANKTFGPNETLTRAQAAVVLLNTYNYYNNGFVFKDIRNYWAKAQIEKLYHLGIVSGYSNGDFKPKRPINRAEFIAILISMMGYKSSNNAQTFKDVPKKYWGYSSIQAAVDQGIINPKDYNGNFNPNKPLTRQEMAIFMGRAVKIQPVQSPKLSFIDKNKITAGQGYIAAEVKAQLIKGHANNSFGPNETATRAQASVILYNLYQYCLNSQDINVPTPNPNYNKQPNEVVVQKSVKALPKTTVSNSLTSVSSDGKVYTFKDNADIKSLKVGDVFTLPPTKTSPSGVARKITQINYQNGEIKLTTSQPTMEEVFKKINIDSSIPIDQKNIVTLQLGTGVTPLTSNKTTTTSLKNLTNNQKYASVPSSINQIEPQHNLGAKKVTVSGGNNAIDLGYTISKDIKINSKVKLSLQGTIALDETQLNTIVHYNRNWLHPIKEAKVDLKTNPTFTGVASVSKSGSESAITFNTGLDRKTSGSFTIPDWLKNEEASSPISKKILITKDYIPVEGPVGANLEVYLILNADFTFNIQAKLVSSSTLDVGVSYLNGDMNPIHKFGRNPSQFIIDGSGGVQADAGPGFGVYLAGLGISIAGLQGEGGLTGDIYGHVITGIGADMMSNNPNSSNSINLPHFCYESRIGVFFQVDATLNFLNKHLKLLRANNYFDKIGNCSGERLTSDPKSVVMTKGDSTTVHLKLTQFDQKELTLSDKSSQLNNLTVNSKISGDNVIKVTPMIATNGYDLKITANKDAKENSVANLTVTFEDQTTHKITSKVIKIYISTPEKISAIPNPISIGAGQSIPLTLDAYIKDNSENATYVHGKALPLKVDISSDPNVTYSSDNPSIVTVDSSGNVKAADINKKATANINISYEGLTTTIPVTVTPVQLSPGGGSGTVYAGGGNEYSSAYIQKVKDLIIAAEKQANSTFSPEASSNYPALFSDLVPMINDYYTMNYINTQWKKVYENNLKWFSDPHLLYPLTEATQNNTASTFTIITGTDNQILASVQVPLRSDEISGAKFKYLYSLIKDNGVWKLDQITCTSPAIPQG